ncbi:T9SS type A sorting domain-containing protein [Winogradskyella alexanderae]|uniref:T9SS type A sorting domain-containing protein n=1 Tax=Winogradskyella alexanderae TaxID=2877123 RepID=A0ABS7XTJ1_9FLAO|nr:T9SS type A sorting domain-containing protein [Winogradskyella alexanderae]MCA0132794.1 T9SS type A sorting domain-containing protein [Winogradskyella alexanderae]
MKTKLIIALMCICSSCLYAQNISYQSWINQFTATGSSCSSEVGDEEYTWYGYVSDNVYTTETSTGCKEKTTNGATTLSGTFGLRTRNSTTATSITGRLRAWEDDSGDRCTYNSGGINSDDCSTNISSSYSLSNPVEYEFTTGTRTIGNGNFTMEMEYQYRYSVTTLGLAVDNSSESFSTTGTRQFWGSIGSWADVDDDCAASGTIGNNQTSSFQTTVNNKSSVAFRWRASSEPNDYLRVYINGVLNDEISGEPGWLTKTINLTGSSNTIKWEYQKDGSGSGGIDRGFVDDISFAESTLAVVTNELEGVSIYPNPVRSTLNFQGLETNTYELVMYNTLGAEIKTLKIIRPYVDMSALNNGIYIIRLFTDTSQKTFRVVKI